jgi:type I restriction enzyme M protein
MKFDFIVSNPPFKTDFSASIENLKADKYDRFFAGLPNIPNKDKNGMAIYETFLQHVVASLSDRGKAAIVVPTGFVSASNGIPLKIRQHLVDKNWLRGVIHMPSNIFATTGTSVSIVFIDKTKVDDKVMLMDASNLGTKISLEDGQRTVLSDDEKNRISTFFKGRIKEPEFSVLVSNNDIKENRYSIQAGQYVELIEDELGDDIDERLTSLRTELVKNLKESLELNNIILKSFEE